MSFLDNQNQSNFLQEVLFNDIQETEISKIIEENVFTFVCGYLLKKCLKIHYCDICEDYSKSGTLLNQNIIYSYYRATIAHKIILSVICVWLQTNLLFM